jgi:hypothetical protein
MAEVQYLASKLPDGLTWDEDRGLVAEGLVARQVADHLVLPRPGRRFATCAASPHARWTTRVATRSWECIWRGSSRAAPSAAIDAWTRHSATS